jgi:hypothetical protein
MRVLLVARFLAVSALASLASAACSGGTGGSAGDQDAGSDGAGTVTFSCSHAIVCTELLAAPSKMLALVQACGSDMGAFGTGCPTDGSFGCCAQSTETQCYYTAGEAMLGETFCASPGMTWSSPDDQ